MSKSNMSQSVLHKLMMSLAPKRKHQKKFKRPMMKRKIDLPEVKYNDNAISDTTLSATGESVLVQTISQGSDNTNRIGRKVNVKAVHYNLQISATIADLSSVNYPENSDSIRVSLVYDKQPNGVLGTYNQVYNANNSATTPFALRNMDYINRFKVLATDLVTISAAGPNGVNIQRYVKCDLVTRYDGTGATISDIESGSIILVYGDINTAGASQGTIQGVVRLSFTDV